MLAPIRPTSHPAGARSALWLLLLALLSATGEAIAQEGTLMPGQRVRLTGSSFRSVGLVTSSGAEGVTLAMDNVPGPVEVPWSRVSRIEVRRALSPGAGALRGARWGGMIGGALGLFVVGTTFTPEEDLSASQFLTTITLEAAVVGAVIGAIRPGGAWIPLPSGSKVSLGRAGDAAVLAVRVAH